MNEFMQLIAAVRKLAADVRGRAGVAAIAADAAAVFQLLGGMAGQIAPAPAPDPNAVPALAAHLSAVPWLAAPAVADRLDQWAAEHEPQAAKIGVAANAGAFGGGAWLKKLLPILLQALVAGLSGI